MSMMSSEEEAYRIVRRNDGNIVYTYAMTKADALRAIKALGTEKYLVQKIEWVEADLPKPMPQLPHTLWTTQTNQDVVATPQVEGSAIIAHWKRQHRVNGWRLFKSVLVWEEVE